MATFNRDLLIVSLMDIVSAGGVLVGDHVAPKEGGWEAGQPGIGKYTAYAVINAGPVSIQASVLCPGDYDHVAQIQMKCYGSSRAQADTISMMVAQAINNAVDRPIGEYKFRTHWRTGIGAVQRIDDTNPKGWLVTDTYSFECVVVRGKGS